jgi:hypothetical protein
MKTLSRVRHGERNEQKKHAVRGVVLRRRDHRERDDVFWNGIDRRTDLRDRLGRNHFWRNPVRARRGQHRTKQSTLAVTKET